MPEYVAQREIDEQAALGVGMKKKRKEFSGEWCGDLSEGLTGLNDMDQNVVTLIIGLAGISSTLISSGLGIYYTARAGSAPLRELLYSKQVELISKIIHKQARYRVYATVLSGSETAVFHERARADIRECVKEYSELTEQAAAILPTDLWVEINRLSTSMTDLTVDYDATSKIDKDKLIEIVAIDAKVALLSRAVLGVDELTDESLRLFSKRKEFESLTNLELKELEERARQSTD